jgi:sortase A
MAKLKLTNLCSSVVIMGGVLFGGYHGYMWFDQSYLIGEKVIHQPETSNQSTKKTKIEHDVGSVVYPSDLHPKQGQDFGQLVIPKLNTTLPIIEGAEEEQLAKGVAHVPETVLPGEPDVTLLSGHRDTVFRRVGELEKGDKLIINTEMGQFTYQIEDTKIVNADEKINSIGKPYLILSTCYPFTYIGPAPQRYLILAKLHPN